MNSRAERYNSKPTHEMDAAQCSSVQLGAAQCSFRCSLIKNVQCRSSLELRIVRAAQCRYWCGRETASRVQRNTAHSRQRSKNTRESLSILSCLLKWACVTVRCIESSSSEVGICSSLQSTNVSSSRSGLLVTSYSGYCADCSSHNGHETERQK